VEAGGELERVVALAGGEGGGAAGDADVPGGDPGFAERWQAFADIEASPPEREISRIGTRTPPGP